MLHATAFPSAVENASSLKNVAANEIGKWGGGGLMIKFCKEAKILRLGFYIHRNSLFG